MIPSPSEPGFDRVLVVAALILAAAMRFEGRRRMIDKDPWYLAVGTSLFTTGTLGVWTAGWFVLAAVSPPIRNYVSPYLIFVVIVVLSVLWLNPLDKDQPAGKRKPILLSLLYGGPLIASGFAAPTFALIGWAGSMDRVEALERGAIPVVRPADLPSHAEPLVRLADAGCDIGRSVTYVLGNGKNADETVVFFPVVGEGQGPADPVPAWSRACEGPLDLVRLDGAIPWKLREETPDTIRNAPGAVVVAPITPAEVAAQGRNASWICRIFLLLPLLSGLGKFGLVAPAPGPTRADVQRP